MKKLGMVVVLMLIGLAFAKSNKRNIKTGHLYADGSNEANIINVTSAFVDEYGNTYTQLERWEASHPTLVWEEVLKKHSTMNKVDASYYNVILTYGYTEYNNRMFCIRLAIYINTEYRMQVEYGIADFDRASDTWNEWKAISEEDYKWLETIALGLE